LNTFSRRWRRRRGPGRPIKPRRFGIEPSTSHFVPMEKAYKKNEPIYMTPDELEALRLVDCEGLTQEEAAKSMGISRGTVWRCLDSARRKAAKMLVERRELKIEDS
jgi:predicted DNA-binding protein (UPF0251 family)